MYFGGTTQTKAGQLVKDMLAVGLDAKFMCPDGCFEDAFISSAGAENLNDRALITFGGLPADQLTGKGKTFVDNYVKKYGRQPEAYAAYGYECGRVALEAIRRAGKKDREAAYACLEKVGMADFARRQISQLSGGQQQRVFLARALAQDAKIYFMDEPFVGVDAATERAIVAILQELKSQGRTVIAVHHTLQTVREYFDHVILLTDLLVEPDVAPVRWGDFHGHSNLSDGTGTPEDFLDYARDVAGLDAVCLTDHDHWGMLALDEYPELWERVRAATESRYEPGRFVTVLGYEWTNWIHGHRHVLYFGKEGGEVLSSIDERYETPAQL